MTKHQKSNMGLGLAELVMLLNTGLPDMTGASCARPEVDPDLFFDETPVGIAAAKAICVGCPVAERCLSYALTVKEAGVWGGFSEKERNQLRRNLDSAPQLVDATQLENRRLLCSSMPASALARRFNVSERTIQRWRKQICETGSAGASDIDVLQLESIVEVA